MLSRDGLGGCLFAVITFAWSWGVTYLFVFPTPPLGPSRVYLALANPVTSGLTALAVGWFCHLCSSTAVVALVTG